MFVECLLLMFVAVVLLLFCAVVRVFNVYAPTRQLFVYASQTHQHSLNSHQLVCNELWIVHDGKMTLWEKDWAAYKQMLENEVLY